MLHSGPVPAYHHRCHGAEPPWSSPDAPGRCWTACQAIGGYTDGLPPCPSECRVRKTPRAMRRPSHSMSLQHAVLQRLHLTRALPWVPSDATRSASLRRRQVQPEQEKTQDEQPCSSCWGAGMPTLSGVGLKDASAFVQRICP